MGIPKHLARACEKQTERQFTTTLIAFARLHRWRVAHFRSARVMRGGREIYETPVDGDGKGFLDLELVRSPRLIKAELKVGRNKTTAEQDEWYASYEGIPGIERYIWYPEDWNEIERLLTRS